jgi:membrane protease YdiL (CAAX protease family)
LNSHSQNIPFLFVFILLFALFYGLGLFTSNLDWTWARILICLATVSGVTIAWSLFRKTSLSKSFREVGFGVPNWRVVGIAVVISALMLSFFPLYASLANVNLPLQNNWLWILIGLITGVGIAEETLFRGYVFNFFRMERTFWKAATISMILFGAMHLLLLLWQPLPIAIAAIILAIIAAYPTAYLFESGNRTIWPSAILHTTALATNLFEIPADLMVSLSLLWIGVVVIGLFLVFIAGKLVMSNSITERFRSWPPG